MVFISMCYDSMIGWMCLYLHVLHVRVNDSIASHDFNFCNIPFYSIDTLWIPSIRRLVDGDDTHNNCKIRWFFIINIIDKNCIWQNKHVNHVVARIRGYGYFDCGLYMYRYINNIVVHSMSTEGFNTLTIQPTSNSILFGQTVSAICFLFCGQIEIELVTWTKEIFRQWKIPQIDKKKSNIGQCQCISTLNLWEKSSQLVNCSYSHCIRRMNSVAITD